jgi:hypothetical protein
MPIATCILSGFDPLPAPAGVVATWAEAAGCDPALMTVNFVAGQQDGAGYPALAYLALPDLWPEPQVATLAETLAKVLAAHLGIAIDQVQVLVQVLSSGRVVEDGKLLRWSGD